MLHLANQNILLGVTGGIAAYKSVELIRRLKNEGASVRVVMTAAAQAFITPLTLQAVSGEPVFSALLSEEAEAVMNHIALARWADWIVIAPASANVIARLAHGYANDLLTTLCLASAAPILVVPAMNRLMWENAATQANVQQLCARDIYFCGPEAGVQACGEVGLGRMVEPQAIVSELILRQKTGFLSGKRVLITAGPTREPIDPVRYLSNKSSGKMGYALAEAAVAAGAKVSLISGPVYVVADKVITLEIVETAEEMLAHVMIQITGVDIFIATAAVADYRVDAIATHKIKKNQDEMQLTLRKNPDILAAVAALPCPPFTVGFAAETEELLINAKKKYLSKRVNIMLANDVNSKSSGFDRDDNGVTAVWCDKKKIFPVTSKKVLAKQLIQFIGERYHESHST